MNISNELDTRLVIRKDRHRFWQHSMRSTLSSLDTI